MLNFFFFKTNVFLINTLYVWKGNLIFAIWSVTDKAIFLYSPSGLYNETIFKMSVLSITHKNQKTSTNLIWRVFKYEEGLYVGWAGTVWQLVKHFIILSEEFVQTCFFIFITRSFIRICILIFLKYNYFLCLDICIAHVSFYIIK